MKYVQPLAKKPASGDEDLPQRNKVNEKRE